MSSETRGISNSELVALASAVLVVNFSRLEPVGTLCLLPHLLASVPTAKHPFVCCLLRCTARVLSDSPFSILHGAGLAERFEFASCSYNEPEVCCE